VWFATFLVSLFVTWNSGKTGDRTIHIIGLMCIAVTGNIMVTASSSTAVRFVAMFLMPIGANSAFQLVVTFVSSSFPRPFEKRAAVVALASAIANSATIYGSYMYPKSDGPRYIPGGSATAGVSLLVAIVTLVTRLWHQRLNGRLNELEHKDIEGHNSSAHSVGRRRQRYMT
jgi:MFS family permease